MRKFLAVVKHEYKKIVFTWTFIISTVLAPLFLGAISLVPLLMMSLKSSAVRLVIVDQSGKLAPRIRENLSPEKQLEKYREAVEDQFKKIDATQDEKLKQSARQIGGNFKFEDFSSEGKSVEAIKLELSEQIKQDKLDAYLIVPPDIVADNTNFEFFTRNSSDFVTNDTLESAVTEAVRAERLAKANISEKQLREINKKVTFSKTKVSEKGEEKDDGNSFWIGFSVGLMIYLSLTIYGTMILQAVIEEKETRIAEILFSSARPFELMMGKLVGVGLAGLTQISIWLFSALILLGYFSAVAGESGMSLSIPSITPGFVVYFLLFFLLGFFIYATIYALIGSMISNAQEGGQVVMFPMLILMTGLFSVFAVIRDPGSSFAFGMSVAPFLAPIIMPVRIMIETPPFWQIALAVILNVLAILGLVWTAARVYRVGMLMYGKRATIPEVWKWIKQA